MLSKCIYVQGKMVKICNVGLNETNTRLYIVSKRHKKPLFRKLDETLLPHRIFKALMPSFFFFLFFSIYSMVHVFHVQCMALDFEGRFLWCGGPRQPTCLDVL